MNKQQVVSILSANSRRAVCAYTFEVCVLAFALHRSGEGASTVATYTGLKTTSQADAAINAGREIDAACKSRLVA